MTAPTRELQQLAATAAGLQPGHDVGQYAWCPQRECLVRCNAGASDTPWTPWADDSQAFWLATQISKRAPGGVLCLSIGQNQTACEFNYATGPDVASATRQAIFLAAVQMGRSAR